jgi:branched-chain amino acid transport system permease protein
MNLPSRHAAAGGVLFLTLAALPQLPLTDLGIPANLLTELLILSVLALGLNVILGTTGLLHLGIAAFYGIGCCIAGILTTSIFPFQTSFLTAMVVAVVGTALVGLLLGAPVLRLRGDYLALVTLGFGQIVITVLLEFENITGGKKTLQGLFPPLLPFVDEGVLGRRGAWQAFPDFYYLCLGLLGFVYLGLGNLERSRLGRGLVAVREDELAAGAMGLNPARLKLIALAIGAGIAGLAGALFAMHNTNTTEPQNSFNFNWSIIILAAVILGGLNSRAGVLWGVVLLMGFDKIGTRLIDEQLQAMATDSASAFKMANWRLMIFGLVLIVMMRFRPHGLLPERRGANH